MVSLISWVEFGYGLINFNSSFLNTLMQEEFRIFISRPFQESLEKICLVLKLEILLLWKLLVALASFFRGISWKRYEGDFYEKFCKINIIFLTKVSILRILSLILEKVSQEMYLLLLQLLPWLRYIEQIQDFCEMIH